MTCEHLLDDCGCCPGADVTPEVTPTPGRPAVTRRVGTAAAFGRAMTADLSRQPALGDFTNRRSDDPAIALVDAWSVVLDVLTFYTERVANEGYLRTSLEPRSLTELARSVGYTPGRGRAAGALLAFTLEDAIGAPSLVPIPTGTKVASLPGPGETPQNYETVTGIDARPEWNAIRAQTRAPQQLASGATQALVEGIRTDLTAGDALLLVGPEREDAAASAHWAFRLLSGVHPLPDLDATRLLWAEPLGSPAEGSGRVGDEMLPDPRDARLFVLRRRAGVFGAAAPDYRIISRSVTGASRLVSPDWPCFSVQAPGQPENTVDLDALYPAAVAGSWAVFTQPGVTVCYRIVTATETSRTDFTLNAKVTRLLLQGPAVSGRFGTSVRQTAVFVGSEMLPLAETPVVLPVQGDLVDLAAAVPTPEAGRSVIVRGPRPAVRVAEGVRDLKLRAAGKPDVTLHPGDQLEVIGPVQPNPDGSATWPTTRGLVTAAGGALARVSPAEGSVVHSEVAMVAGPTPQTPEVQQLRLAAALAGCYERDAVRILANVAPATHGETRTQVLGSGDAASRYQRFTLAQNPLTYLASASGGAVVTTLAVRVDGRLWNEVPRLFGSAPADEVFTTEMDDDGNVTVCFGDGLTGARLPTGTNNVTATYRVGTGVTGRVGADTLTLPMSRPLGLRSVTNPLPAGLAADLETPDAVRTNAARTALTLDRVVSLRDVEDFARSMPGVSKAKAAWLWDGRRRLVHLTVAGSGTQTVDAQAIVDLDAAIRSVGDPRTPLRIDPAELVAVPVAASVVADPSHDGAAVAAAVSAALTRALGVEARALAQPLATGDIVVAAHGVPGTVAITVTSPVGDVTSREARVDGATVLPAQLVFLAPGGLKLTEAAS